MREIILLLRSRREDRADQAVSLGQSSLAVAALTQDLPLPAYIIGARFDLLCWNRAAVEMSRDFSQVPENERNTLYQMFVCRELREIYQNWEIDARAMLESFRSTYDLMSHVPEFVSLKDELCARSAKFRTW
jgi:hypothetical protein